MTTSDRPAPSIATYDVFDDAAKKRFLETPVAQYIARTLNRIRERYIWYWPQVDAGLGQKIAESVGAQTVAAIAPD